MDCGDLYFSSHWVIYRKDHGQSWSFRREKGNIFCFCTWTSNWLIIFCGARQLRFGKEQGRIKEGGGRKTEKSISEILNWKSKSSKSTGECLFLLVGITQVPGWVLRQAVFPKEPVTQGLIKKILQAKHAQIQHEFWRSLSLICWFLEMRKRLSNKSPQWVGG